MIGKEDLIEYSPTKPIKRRYDYHPPITTEAKRKKAQEIIEQSCQILNVSNADFFSPLKNRKLSDARYMIASVLFFHYGLNTEEISQVTGRHRTTINHSLNMSRKLFRYNTEFKERFTEFKTILNV
jgi:chromosomal replication initiation ATPase DnaA